MTLAQASDGEQLQDIAKLNLQAILCGESLAETPLKEAIERVVSQTCDTGDNCYTAFGNVP